MISCDLQDRKKETSFINLFHVCMYIDSVTLVRLSFTSLVRRLPRKISNNITSLYYFIISFLSSYSSQHSVLCLHSLIEAQIITRFLFTVKWYGFHADLFHGKVDEDLWRYSDCVRPMPVSQTFILSECHEFELISWSVSSTTTPLFLLPMVSSSPIAPKGQSC